MQRLLPWRKVIPAQHQMHFFSEHDESKRYKNKLKQLIDLGHGAKGTSDGINEIAGAATESDEDLLTLRLEAIVRYDLLCLKNNLDSEDVFEKDAEIDHLRSEGFRVPECKQRVENLRKIAGSFSTKLNCNDIRKAHLAWVKKNVTKKYTQQELDEMERELKGSGRFNAQLSGWLERDFERKLDKECGASSIARHDTNCYRGEFDSEMATDALAVIAKLESMKIPVPSRQERDKALQDILNSCDEVDKEHYENYGWSMTHYKWMLKVIFNK